MTFLLFKFVATGLCGRPSIPGAFMKKCFIAALFIAACGPAPENTNGNTPLNPGSTTTGTYAAKCKVSCRAPDSGPCKAQNSAQCESDCTVLSEGLSVECATCIVEHSGWTGLMCANGCNGQYAAPFGPGGYGSAVPCSPNSPPTTCSASDEKCTSYVVPKTSDSTCYSACKPK